MPGALAARPLFGAWDLDQQGSPGALGGVVFRGRLPAGRYGTLGDGYHQCCRSYCCAVGDGNNFKVFSVCEAAGFDRRSNVNKFIGAQLGC